MIERVVTYGLPSDDFEKIVDEYKLDGAILYRTSTIYMRGQVPQISIDLVVTPEMIWGE